MSIETVVAVSGAAVAVFALFWNIYWSHQTTKREVQHKLAERAYARISLLREASAEYIAEAVEIYHLRKAGKKQSESDPIVKEWTQLVYKLMLLLPSKKRKRVEDWHDDLFGLMTFKGRSEEEVAQNFGAAAKQIEGFSDFICEIIDSEMEDAATMLVGEDT
ncbi:MAG: hypothetical protein AAF638_07695 [Pseudomonadota bacterium]